MKTKTIQQLVLTFIIMMSVNLSQIFATTFNVTAANFSFSPANIDVTVGDTIKWTRANGSHTTTCDGSNGTTRPSGAASWNSGLNASAPTFTYVIRVAGTYHYVCEPHAPDMAGNINAVASAIIQNSQLVDNYKLSQNFPNPFNPTTNIKFAITGAANVSLKIFDVSGKEVQTLVNERLSAGSYQVDWNALNFSSGVYYYKIETAGFTQTRKMLLIK